MTIRNAKIRTLKARWTVAAVLVVIGTAGSATAHHGWGSYDAAKKFTITAPVKHIAWSNPHAHLMLDHADGEWEATLAPISRMESRGLSEAMLKAGTMVSVEGYPSTKSEREMRAERIIVDGKTIELR